MHGAGAFPSSSAPRSRSSSISCAATCTRAKPSSRRVRWACTRSPLQGLLQHPREVAIVIGLTLGGTVAFYTYTTYMQKFLVNSVGLRRTPSTVIAAGTLFLYMCLQPVVGAISDIVGRRPVLSPSACSARCSPCPSSPLCRPPRSVDCVLSDHGRAGDRQRLHGDQRGGEGGAVSDRRARHGRRLPVRHHGGAVRRHGRIRGPLLEGDWLRACLLLVCDGAAFSFRCSSTGACATPAMHPP